jgi:hypothetical protein
MTACLGSFGFFLEIEARGILARITDTEDMDFRGKYCVHDAITPDQPGSVAFHGQLAGFRVQKNTGVCSHKQLAQFFAVRI